MESLAKEIIVNKDFTNNHEDEFWKAIFVQKQQRQDNRMDGFSDSLDDLNIKVNNLLQAEYNYNHRGTDVECTSVVDEEIMKNSEENKLIQDIVFEIKKMKEYDEIQDQIAACASISNKCLNLLKIIRRSGHDNQRKSTIHLFFQAVKRNYAKKIFTCEQINLMLLMISECQNEFVSESKYYEFDEELYKLNLSVFPEEE